MAASTVRRRLGWDRPGGPNGASSRQNGALGLLGSGWAGQVVALTAENVTSSRQRDGSGEIFGARARSCVFMAVGGAQRAQSLNCSQTATR